MLGVWVACCLYVGENEFPHFSECFLFKQSSHNGAEDGPSKTGTTIQPITAADILSAVWLSA